MNYIQNMRHLAPDLGTFASLAITTDGLSPNKHHLMSISLMSKFVTEPVTIFLQGADPDAVLQFTGITRQLYEQHAVGPARAQELFNNYMDEWQVDVLVSYTVNRFTLPFIKAGLPEFMLQNDKTLWLDALHLLAHCNQGCPPEGNTIEDMLTRLNSRTDVKMSVNAAIAQCLQRPAATDTGARLPHYLQRIRDLYEIQEWLEQKEN